MAHRKTERDPLFAGRWFEDDIILLCLRWYFRFKLSYRDLVEILGERGLSISHTTILRWVVRYANTYEKLWHRVGRPLALRSLPRSKPRTPASLCPPERPLHAGYDRSRGANMEQ